MRTDDLRFAFEECCKERGMPPEAMEPILDGYVDQRVDSYWLGFKMHAELMDSVPLAGPITARTTISQIGPVSETVRVEYGHNDPLF